MNGQLEEAKTSKEEMKNMSKHDLYHTEPYARLKLNFQNLRQNSQKRYLNRVIDIQAESSLFSVTICIEIMVTKRAYYFARFFLHFPTAFFLSENLLTLFGQYFDVCW